MLWLYLQLIPKSSALQSPSSGKIGRGPTRLYLEGNCRIRCKLPSFSCHTDEVNKRLQVRIFPAIQWGLLAGRQGIIQGHHKSQPMHRMLHYACIEIQVRVSTCILLPLSLCLLIPKLLKEVYQIRTLLLLGKGGHSWGNWVCNWDPSGYLHSSGCPKPIMYSLLCLRRPTKVGMVLYNHVRIWQQLHTQQPNTKSTKNQIHMF